MEYKYDEDVLKKLHKTLEEMLKVFDDICMKYQIDYFVSFGTAIGALRHKGFIPWDDDLDVCMMREDYQRLLEVPENEWKGLRLIDATVDFSAHTLIYPQIYKPGTIFQTEYHYRYDEFKNGKENCQLPIWIDIFLMDYVTSTKNVIRISKKAFLLQKLYYYSKSKIRVYKDDSISLRFLCRAKRITHCMLSLFDNISSIIYSKYISTVTSCKNGDYLTSFDLAKKEEVQLFCGKASDFFPVLRVPFEGITVSIQKNYDDALKRLYGDYMTMPPMENRYNHPPQILDFGEGNVIV